MRCHVQSCPITPSSRQFFKYGLTASSPAVYLLPKDYRERNGTLRASPRDTKIDHEGLDASRVSRRFSIFVAASSLRRCFYRRAGTRNLLDKSFSGCFFLAAPLDRASQLPGSSI